MPHKTFNLMGRSQKGEEFGRSAPGKVFLGGLPLLSGVLTVLVSLSVLPYVDTRPNRIAIFNDPHSWEVFAIGTMQSTFGLAFLIPPRMRWLGQLNKWVLLISFAAVLVGVLRRKLF